MGLWGEEDTWQFAAGKPIAFVVKWARWCPHCETMIEQFGPYFRNTPTVQFAEEQQLDAQSRRDRFPHVYMFINGQPSMENVSPLQLLRFLQRQPAPPIAAAAIEAAERRRARARSYARR